MRVRHLVVTRGRCVCVHEQQKMYYIFVEHKKWTQSKRSTVWPSGWRIEKAFIWPWLCPSYKRWLVLAMQAFLKTENQKTTVCLLLRQARRATNLIRVPHWPLTMTHHRVNAQEKQVQDGHTGVCCARRLRLTHMITWSHDLTRTRKWTAVALSLITYAPNLTSIQITTHLSGCCCFFLNVFFSKGLFRIIFFSHMSR